MKYKRGGIVPGGTRIPHNISLAWSAGITVDHVVNQYRHEVRRGRVSEHEVLACVTRYYAMLDGFMDEITRAGIDWSYVRREG